jgi:CheY-like chemotaxis protein
MAAHGTPLFACESNRYLGCKLTQKIQKASLLSGLEAPCEGTRPYDPATAMLRLARKDGIASPSHVLGERNVKTVLVADDNAAGRELVRTVLESCGYKITEAADLEALRAARDLRPDLIILDLNMPGMDGFELIRQLRRDTEFAVTPVLALTASAIQGDRQHAIDAGFTDYMSKPIGPRQLRIEVERLLQRPV